MPRHYVYRMDHDTGKAPCVTRGLCTLCGCKTNTVEMWAEPGSWVVGIGGNGTGQPDRLIYALRVDSILSPAEFRRLMPARHRQLRGRVRRWNRVLVSRHFYYLGHKAIPLPRSLSRLRVHTQGCKRVDTEDVARLDRYLMRRFGTGAHGLRNNVAASEDCVRTKPQSRCRKPRPCRDMR